MEVGRHPVVVGHLVMGTLFAVLVGAYVLLELDVVSIHDFRWLIPIPLIVGGAVGLIAVTAAGLRRSK